MHKENIWFKDFDVLVNEADTEGCMALSHWHDCWEMLFIEKGDVTQLCDGGVTRHRQGDVLLIGPKTVHSTFSGKSGSRVIVVQFNGSLFPGAVQAAYPAAQSPHRAELARLFLQLQEEYRGRQPGYENLTHGALLQIFGYLSRQKAIPAARSQSYFKTRHIFRYIDEHIAQHLSLQQTAQALGYSPQHLTQLIKAYSGYSFKPYTDYVRLTAAVRLLKYEGLTVSAAAEQLGYTDISAFCRAFKRVIGLSPKSVKP